MEISAELLRKHVREEMNAVADAVATGVCQDFAAYQHMTGKIEGLAFAERMLLDMVEAAKKTEEGEDK